MNLRPALALGIPRPGRAGGIDRGFDLHCFDADRNEPLDQLHDVTRVVVLIAPVVGIVDDPAAASVICRYLIPFEDPAQR